jgi:iron complex transport system ATP-binding protein
MNTPGSIQARGVRVALSGRWVVDGVDLDAAGGQITAIVGPNGSGKTTLLRALAGLAPFEGHVEHGGRDLRGMAPRERAERVAYLPQSSSLNAMLSVREVVALARYASHPGLFSKTRRDDVAIERALARANILELADAAYPQLSGGQRRLVLLARALASGASTLLLDEPTASLDLKHALSLFALLTSLAREGYCVVLVLHDLDDVQRYAAHAVLLHAGKVRASGAPSSSGFVGAAEATYAVSLIEHDRVGFRLRPELEGPP